MESLTQPTLMKSPILKTAATLLTALALLPANTNAADVQGYLVAKGQQLQQTNTGVPALDHATNQPHRFFSAVDGSASNSILGVTLKVPNATVKIFTNEDGGFMFQQAFTNKTLLDAAFGVGSYAFTIQTLLDGTNKPILKLPADAYPTAPHIANWPDAQAIEASLPFVLYWDAFAGGTTNDFVQLDVEDDNGEPIANSPDLLNPSHLNGTNGSALIPADTFSENHTYNARVLFVKRTTATTTNLPGATGSAGYFRQTQFPLTTLPAAPDGARVQFSASTFAALEDTGDSLVVIVTRTGTNEAALDVQLTMTDGTATSGLDYINTPTTVHFAEGAQSAVVSVPIQDDYLLEGNETITLSLSAPTVGSLGARSNAVFTIVDNEVASAGKIQFTARAFNALETSGAAKPTLTRIGGSTGAISVNFHTVAGTATSDADFTATNGTLNFTSGQLTGTIPVPVRNDALDETNETFWVILDSTAGGAAFGTNLEATITITDDDTAGLIAFKSATFSTNENSGSALITVARTGGAAGGVTVNFATANGTATAGLDYSATNGTLTFGSNELTKTFSVIITNDFEIETNETILLTLSNPDGGAKLGAISNATLRITDEESKFSFTNATYAVTEAGPSISINVLRSGSLITTSAVTFATANVSAISTNDYRATNGTLVFPINTAFKTLIIPIANDTIVESNETFTLTLSSPLNGAQLGTIPVTTVTITENDLGGVIFFATNSYSVTENGTNATITLSRTNGIASAVSVDFTTSDGSAESIADYSGGTQTIVFAAGETSKKVLIPIVNDTTDETNETVFLALSNPQGGGALGTRTNATLTILDNDSGGVIAFKSATFITNENSGAFNVIVVRTNGTASGVTVNFITQNGSAEGDDYSSTNGTLTFGAGETNKTISVPINNDTLPEGNESFTMLLSLPTGGATLGAISNATLTIRDDESSVAFSNATYVVSEAGTNVTLTVIRSGALITPVTVSFSTVDDSAISTNDYRGTNGTLNFPTNVSSLVIKIPIINDTVVESSESFGLFLHTPTSGLQLGTQTNATVTITDNDLGGVIFFATNSYSVTENGTNATITLSRTNGLASAVTVEFNTDDGSADHGDDYTDATQIVTFAAGETSKKVLVPIINDTLDETNETVLLSLDNAEGGASLGSRTNAVLTIVDNDTAGVIAFRSASYTTNENSGSALITVIRTGGAASGVTVDYRTQDGTANHDSDYAETHDTLTFGAGETNKTFSVTITNDVIAELNETLSLLLSEPTGGATLGTITNATLTIVDDESSLSFTNATYVISEAGTNVTVAVLRSGALGTPVSVQFTTTNVTAISTNDYRGTNGTLNFAANVAAQTITIPIVNDTLAEGNETFKLQLFNPAGGVQLGSITNTTVTITENDFGGAIKFSATSYTGVEGSNALITISRTGGVASGVTVQFAVNGGTAISGTDYTNVSGTITFNAGESNKTVSIPIVSDALTETTETANLTLSSPTGTATLGSPTSAVLNITDRPDPNAIPEAGAVFFNASVGGVAVNGLALTITNFSDGQGLNNSLLNVTGATTGSPFKSFSLQNVVANGTGTVPILSSSANGDILYMFQNGFTPVITTTLETGGGGTVKIDVLNKDSKTITGRFDVITVDSITTTTYHVVGSFRMHWQ